MRLHNLAIDEKVPLMEATGADDVINQPITLLGNDKNVIKSLKFIKKSDNMVNFTKNFKE